MIYSKEVQEMCVVPPGRATVSYLLPFTKYLLVVV